MVELILLQPADREQFIKDNQWAFRYGALAEFGKRNDQFEEGDEIIARQTIENCIDQGTAYRIWQNGQKAGGAVVNIKGDHGSLELLFVNPTMHSHGIGKAAWRAIEQIYPKVKVWETITPYFETRNIHFYVNKLKRATSIFTLTSAALRSLSSIIRAILIPAGRLLIIKSAGWIFALKKEWNRRYH